MNVNLTVVEGMTDVEAGMHVMAMNHLALMEENRWQILFMDEVKDVVRYSPVLIGIHQVQRWFGMGSN